MNHAPFSEQDLAARRAAARRTALIFAGVALVAYVGFLVFYMVTT